MVSRADYILAQQAESDLIEIARHMVARWGPQQQHTYITGLYSLFEEITEQPLLGATRPELGSLTRMRLYMRSHTVYYDYTESGQVEILRILHVRQDSKVVFRE